MASETARILGTLGQGPLVFNLGHGIVPSTPPDHVAALADLIRNWRAPS
jgi:uroporphyrinogen decarboxylase